MKRVDDQESEPEMTDAERVDQLEERMELMEAVVEKLAEGHANLVSLVRSMKDRGTGNGHGRIITPS